MSLLLSARRFGKRVLPESWASDYSSKSVHLGIALGYLALITLAELVTAFVEPRAGLILHGGLLVILLIHTALSTGQPYHRLLLCLVLAPLIRMLSLSLPLIDVPVIYWYAIISVPLLIATFLAARLLSFTRAQVGLTLRNMPLQFLAALTGVTFGVTEYYILRPDPLAPSHTWQSLVISGAILLICTGFAEEFMFRGVIQRASVQVLGRFGLLYVALLFAALHIGYRSLLDVVFVFSVAILFGWVAEATWSLLGVTVAHGLTNIVLFLIMPGLGR